MCDCRLSVYKDILMKVTSNADQLEEASDTFIQRFLRDQSTLVFLPCRLSWTEESGGLQSMGLHKVRQLSN